MSVRLRLALTLLITGLVTALGVLVAVALAFERFEREAAYARADAFLGRVVALHDDLPAQQRRDPEAFTAFLRSLLLFEPDSQLYLLTPEGTVLASTGSKTLAPDFKVAMGPVREAAAAAATPTTTAPSTATSVLAPASSPRRAASQAPAPAAQRAPAGRAAYVMGDDPEHMADDAVIAARGLRQPSIRPGADLAGYLYLVCRKPDLPPSRLARLAGQLAGPALGPVLAVVLLATLLAAWIIAAVTRPLAVLSHAVAEATRAGFSAEAPTRFVVPKMRWGGDDDEFTRLRTGFEMLLSKLHAQWDQLKRLDAFRRESVSNLSHDLRSPLTAAAASLETLQQRWRAQGSAAGTEEARLVEVALRNTHNAARLVRALGDLAVLDEAGFGLRLARLDLAEMLDDIVLRFAERAARQGVTLLFRVEGDEAQPGSGAIDDRSSFSSDGSNGSSISNGPDTAPRGGGPLAAEVDVELIERAIANLLDNALRHTPAAGRVVLSAHHHRGAAGAGGEPTLMVRVRVQDSGSGIAAADLAHLFDRHFRGGSRAGGDARAEGGKGLGLAIVQRIVELHRGHVRVDSEPGRGTVVTLDLPVAAGG